VVYNGITEKVMDFGQYRVRVDLGDGNTMFFWFNHDPTEEEVRIVTETYILNFNRPPPSSKSIELKMAEDKFVLFCRSLGLADKADSEAIETLVMSLKQSGQEMLAIEVSLRSLALINNVTQNGGLWKDIEYHGLLT
jgi:hypothetical protein